mgnify:CR=1 FL=1
MATYTVASIQRKCIKQRRYYSSAGTSYYSSSILYVGQAANGSGRLDSWRMLTQFDSLPDSITNSTASVTAIKIPYNIYDVLCYGATLEFRIRIPAAKNNISSAYEEIFAICTGGTLLTGTISVGDGETYSGTLTITDQSLIALVLDRGFAFDFATSIGNESTVTHAYGRIGFNEIQIEYENLNTAPEVSLPAGTPYETTSLITEPFLLKWTYAQLSDSPQTAIDMDIRAGDEAFVNVLSKYPLTVPQYQIAPEKFPAPYTISSDVYIRLRAYSEAGAVSEYTATHIILIFPQLKNLSPGNAEIILSSDTIRLRWEIYAADSDGTQYEITNYPTEFDIQYSRNSGESWNSLGEKITAAREGNSYYYDVPANTFANGIITWRVRPYVNGYAINEYVQDVFVVEVQASTSSVICDGKPLPTVSWTSSSQIAYQVRFADYDSGARYGADTSFTVPFFYADGYYPVQVRTQASDGTWSAWTEPEYVRITNTPPSDTVTLTAVPTRHAVVLNWTDSGTPETYIVYRDHVPVYVGTDTTFTDITANGECTYYVRAVRQTTYYAQSDSVTVNACPKTDCLYDFSSMQWIPLKYSLQERSRNYSSSADVVYKNYAGRAKPVAFSSGHTVRQMSGSYVFKTRAEVLRLRNTAGKTVIFKDTRGGTIIGILNDPVITVQRKLYAVTFLVTETDYTEEREYAPE